MCGGLEKKGSGTFLRDVVRIFWRCFLDERWECGQREENVYQQVLEFFKSFFSSKLLRDSLANACKDKSTTGMFTRTVSSYTKNDFFRCALQGTT